MKRISVSVGVAVLILVAGISIAPTPAHAQARYSSRSYPGFTFSPFVGVRFGGRIDVNTPSIDYLPIDGSFNGGFNVGVGVAPNLFTEFMWNRQTTTLSAHHTNTNTDVPLTNRAHLDLYQVSLLYEFAPNSYRYSSGSQLRPFVVGGVGFTHFDSHGILSFDNRLSYNLGGGVKYLFTPQIALRAEMRYSPSRTTSSSTVFCDPTLGCFTTPIHNHAKQGQANIGIEFRF